MKSYGITNPEQLIELFEMRARLAALMASSISPMPNNRTAADVWREAADVVRSVEFVGWPDKITMQPEKQHDGHDKAPSSRR
jgi:hypothetical protein